MEALSDASWQPYVEAGRFRLLATFGSERSPRYPQVPTVREIGYDMVRPSPIQIFGPKGLPRPVVKKLHDAFKKSLDDPDYLSILKKYDMTPNYLGPEDLDKAILQESDQVKRVVQKLGLDKK